MGAQVLRMPLRAPNLFFLFLNGRIGDEGTSGRQSEDGMILWAIVICAVVGFALGTHCRLFPLAAASALVVACLPLVLHATDSTLVSGGFAVLGLLAVLQAFFLVGAVLRVSSPVSRSTEGVLGRQPGSARQRLAMRAAGSEN